MFAAYAAAAPRGAVLVVPTARDARHYERELGRRRRWAATGGARLGAHVRRPRRPDRRADGLRGPAPVGAAARAAARAVIARLRRDGLDALQRPARGRGFALAAGELIAELQRSLVTPQRFTAGAARVGGAGCPARRVHPRPRPHLRGLRAGARRAGPGRPRAVRLAGARRAARRTRRAGARPVFVYGFDDLTPLERDAVETLARIPGVEVTVSLTYEPGRHRARRAGRVGGGAAPARRAGPRAARVRRALRARIAGGPAPARARAVRTPRGGRGGAGDPGEVVTLLEAGGERAEAELVAGEILALLRAGTPLRRDRRRAPRAPGPCLAVHPRPRRLRYPARRRRGRPSCATRRSAARCSARPAARARRRRAPGRPARLSARPRPAGAPRGRRRARGRASAATALRDRVALARGAAGAAGAAGRSTRRERARRRSAELRARPPAARRARAVAAAPRARRAEQLDARAVATLVRALDELAELGAAGAAAPAPS